MIKASDIELTEKEKEFIKKHKKMLSENNLSSFLSEMAKFDLFGDTATEPNSIIQLCILLNIDCYSKSNGIPNYTFKRCYFPKPMLILPEAKVILAESFAFCKGLKKLNAPECTVLDQSAFRGSSLEIISLPKLKNILPKMFWHIHDLRMLDLRGVETFPMYENIFKDTGNHSTIMLYIGKQTKLIDSDFNGPQTDEEFEEKYDIKIKRV